MVCNRLPPLGEALLVDGMMDVSIGSAFFAFSVMSVEVMTWDGIASRQASAGIRSLLCMTAFSSNCLACR